MAAAATSAGLKLGRLGLGQLVTQGLDDGVVMIGIAGLGSAEHGGTGDEGVDPGLGDFTDVGRTNAAIDLQANIAAGRLDDLADMARLVQHVGDELLPAETGVDAHDQDQVDQIHQIVEGIDRLTPAEKRYPRAMAELGPGPHRSGDIADQLDRKVTSLGSTRNQLIAKGMIWSPNHGDTAFTVPLFDEFMHRIMPGDDWKT